MPLPRWRAVIVNYRTPDAAVRAATAAKAALSDGDEVCVIDNASGDDSAERLRGIEGIRLLEREHNGGYGAGLNVGAAGFEGDYLLLQNADARIDRPLVERLQHRFEKISTLGVIAPRLRSEDGTIQPSCRRFPTHLSLFRSRGSPLGSGNGRGRSYVLPEPLSFTLCDVVAGACFAVRRRTWQELAGMDESFFLFAEDTDFCKRAKDHGWLVGYEPGVSVAHAWGESRSQEKSATYAWHARALGIYLRKHFPGRHVSNALLSRLMWFHARWRAR